MKIHIIMHESFESPAAIEAWIKKRNFGITYTKLYLGNTFPEECNFDFLIIMGGPQSPATTTNECSYYDAKKEIGFIKKAIDQKKMILGICLGAQLIGEALGASFEHSPNKEIGLFPITLTKDGQQDSHFSDFPKIFNVGHWHGDMPGLTNESKVLATSEGCPRQIIRYAPTIYGFQCHFEFTLEAIDGMIKNSAHELETCKDLPYIESVEELRKNDFSKINNLLFKFLDSLISFSK